MSKPSKSPTNFKQLRKVMVKAGWELVRSRKHEVWRCGCGDHQYIIPMSPSEYRAIKNAVSVLRHCPTLKDSL